MKEAAHISKDWTDCPADFEAIGDFLNLEDFEGNPESLAFFFRAEVTSKKLWVWKYFDGRNQVNYVAVVQSQPTERADMYEIGCGPVGEPGESEDMALAMFTRAGLW